MLNYVKLFFFVLLTFSFAFSLNKIYIYIYIIKKENNFHSLTLLKRKRKRKIIREKCKIILIQWVLKNQLSESYYKIIFVFIFFFVVSLFDSDDFLSLLILQHLLMLRL